MYIAIGGLLLLHGLIHLLGFIHAWKLAQVPGMTGATLVPLSDAAVRGVGLAWLATFLVFGLAGGLRLAQHDLWWPVALAGVVASQVLVVLHWPDAQAGTVANLVIVAALIFWIVRSS